MEALELFELFLGEDLVEIPYAVDSVVEQCFLSLDDACLGCDDLLFVIAVERFVQSLFGVHLLLAEGFECGIHYNALFVKCSSLFVRDLENGIHEFRARAFLEVKLLVERFAFLEVFARTFRAAIAEISVMEAFAMEFAVVLAMMHDVDCLEQQDAPKPRSAKQKAPMANPREQARMMMLAKNVLVEAFII